MTQPVTPDPPATPLPDSGDAAPQDPAAIVDDLEGRVFADGNPLDEPAPELEQQQPVAEPPV